MDNKKRIEYLACTVSVLIVGFIIYGALAGFGGFSDEISNAFVLFGLLGGLGFSMILSGCILFARFIATRSLVFKVLASVFFVISFAAIVYVGIFTYFPYQIYNIVQICKNRKSKQEIEQM